jgi:hypothetical protein
MSPNTSFIVAFTLLAFADRKVIRQGGNLPSKSSALKWSNAC